MTVRSSSEKPFEGDTLNDKLFEWKPKEWSAAGEGMRASKLKRFQAHLQPRRAGSSEADVDTVIAACGGSARAAIRAFIIANEYLNAGVDRLRSSLSVGYVKGRASK